MFFVMCGYAEFVSSIVLLFQTLPLRPRGSRARSTVLQLIYAFLQPEQGALRSLRSVFSTVFTGSCRAPTSGLLSYHDATLYIQ